MRELPDWLHSRASTTPDRAALIVGSREWSYSDLDTETSRVAKRLYTLGVRSGDRVATLLPNGLAAAVLPHAALRLGATLAPLNIRLTRNEIEWQVQDLAPSIVIDNEEILSGEDSDDAPLRFSHPEDAVLAVIYTSGTTGRPKGAMLTVGNFWWSAIGSALNLGVLPDDRWLACLPLFHVGGLSIITRSAIYGICAVVHESFDEENVNRAIDAQGVTIVSAVSVMLERMLDRRGDLPYPSSLRCVLLGGGPASNALLSRAAAMNVPVVQTYGLTETCSQLSTVSPSDAAQRPGSAGKPLYPNDIRIADGDEIVVRGPVVMAGYYNNSSETADAIVDGWLHTGDAGRIDDDGFLYVLDRRDDLIITGGENVYPAEVESVLASHSSIAEAAVIGLPDESWGQRVVAIVRKKRDVSPAELAAFCEERLARFKIPREFRFSRAPLPRTASGKLRRGVVRDEATET